MNNHEVQALLTMVLENHKTQRHVHTISTVNKLNSRLGRADARRRTRQRVAKVLWKFDKHDADNVRLLHVEYSEAFLLYQEQFESKALIAVCATDGMAKEEIVGAA